MAGFWQLLAAFVAAGIIIARRWLSSDDEDRYMQRVLH